MPKTDSGLKRIGGCERELKLCDFFRSEAASVAVPRSDDVGVDLRGGVKIRKDQKKFCKVCKGFESEMA